MLERCRIALAIVLAAGIGFIFGTYGSNSASSGFSSGAPHYLPGVHANARLGASVGPPRASDDDTDATTCKPQHATKLTDADVQSRYTRLDCSGADILHRSCVLTNVCHTWSPARPLGAWTFYAPSEAVDDCFGGVFCPNMTTPDTGTPFVYALPLRYDWATLDPLVEVGHAPPTPGGSGGAGSGGSGSVAWVDTPTLVMKRHFTPNYFHSTCDDYFGAWWLLRQYDRNPACALREMAAVGTTTPPHRAAEEQQQGDEEDKEGEAEAAAAAAEAGEDRDDDEDGGDDTDARQQKGNGMRGVGGSGGGGSVAVRAARAVAASMVPSVSLLLPRRPRRMEAAAAAAVAGDAGSRGHRLARASAQPSSHPPASRRRHRALIVADDISEPYGSYAPDRLRALLPMADMTTIQELHNRLGAETLCFQRVAMG